MIRGVVLMGIGFVVLAFAIPHLAREYSKKATPSLAQVIVSTHSSPVRVYFCATHTATETALIECLGNV